MKTDKLEQFIASNREAFDDSEPNAMLWNRIEKEMTPKAKKIVLPPFVWQAVAASVIFIAAWFGNEAYRNFGTSKNIAATTQFSADEQQMANEVKEALVYYNYKIESKKEQLFTLTSGNPEVEKEVTLALDGLEETLKELKNDLKDGADNQEVIEAVIQNYRLKLKILEEMLLIIDNKNNNEKSNSDETNKEYDQIKI